MENFAKDLGVKPFKIQLVQELKPNDIPQLRFFGERALGKLAEHPLFITISIWKKGILTLVKNMPWG